MSRRRLFMLPGGGLYQGREVVLEAPEPVVTVEELREEMNDLSLRVHDRDYWELLELARAPLPPLGEESPPARRREALATSVVECVGCGHALAQHRDGGPCAQPDCPCERFVVAEDGRPLGWPSSWPWPWTGRRDRTGARRQAPVWMFPRRTRQDAEARAAMRALEAASPPPAMTASARAASEAARSRPHEPAEPYRGGRGWTVRPQEGVPPEQWPVTRHGRPVRGVAMKLGPDGRSLVASVVPSRELEPLPGGTSRMETIAAFARGALDRLHLVASAEIAAEAQAGPIAELVNHVARLVNKPAAPIEVHVAAPLVSIPEQPAPIVHVQPPEVVVNVEQPGPRAVRVEFDEDGNRLYVPVDRDQGRGRGS